MKQVLSVSLLMAALGPTVFADDFSVTAPITNVTVYRDGGAQVTRSGKITLPAGRHTVTFEKLSSSVGAFNNRSTLSFDGPDVLVTGLQIKDGFIAQNPSERQRAIQEKLDVVNGELTMITKKIEAKQLQLGFLQSLKGSPESGDAHSVSVDDWAKAIDFIGNQANQIFVDIQTLETEQSDKRDVRDALMRELDATGELRKDYKFARASVDVATSREVSYSFSYYMDDASWSLDTRAHLDTAAETMKIDVAAKVRQETGEDWNNVALSLSTTEPSDELGSIYQVPLIIGLRDERKEIRHAMAPMQRAAEDEFMIEEIVVDTGAASTNTAFDRFYAAPRPVSIPSTYDEEYVRLTGIQQQVSLVVRSIATDNDGAFLFADTTLVDFDALQSVEATLYRDGHYVGSDDWPDLVPNTLLKLPYGSDPAVSIDVIEQAPEDGDSGFFGSNRVEEKRQLFKVTNNHTEVRLVEIFDQIPVSGHEDLKIRTLKGATPPTEIDMGGREGLRMWRKSLQPGETWEITHAYSMTYPKDKILTEKK